jgi:hypothetical protein
MLSGEGSRKAGLRNAALGIAIGALILAIAQLPACDQGRSVPSSTTAAISPTAVVPAAVAPVLNGCARFAAGGVIYQPPASFRANGVLNVRLSYQQTTDAESRTLFCFVTSDGLGEPTLHVNPGDTLHLRPSWIMTAIGRIDYDRIHKLRLERP